jgi:1,2-dihydroxy-3-keto-5-methylthiopentene dioxygenase
MSALTIAPEDKPESFELLTDHKAISKALDEIGVQFERWETSREIPPNAESGDIISAYQDAIDRLKDTYQFQSVDVIRLQSDHPDRAALRAKFLSEHTHSEFEVRFFVEGKGLFFLHPNDKVYVVLCEKGDLISVPDGVKHWFDMGENPKFTCIRLFTNPEGWVAEYTGDTIADRFPRFETFPGQSQ